MRTDINTTAYRIVRSLTEEKAEPSNRVRAARQAGKAGGVARAKVLTVEQRHEIALAASQARWARGTK